MAIVTTYQVDKNLYYVPDAKHDISLITTEYTYGNEMLIHLQVGKNLGIRLNNCMHHEIADGTALPSEQFLFKKTYRSGNAKPITRITFDEKLKRFDIDKTSVEKEILQDYSYIGKNGSSDNVQIVIKEKAGTITAAIDFRDIEQYENFIYPMFLRLHIY